MKKTVWEVYFDHDKYNLSNDNFSYFIRSKEAPETRQARTILMKAGKDVHYGEGYRIAFIIKSTWGRLPKKDIVEV